MSKRYYENFPEAPCVIVSAIAFGASIPAIVGAWACREGALILEVCQNDAFRLTAAHLDAIVEVLEIEPEDLFVERGNEEEILVVSCLNTRFDFRLLFETEPEVVNLDDRIMPEGT
jgi:hypothetical protein